MTIVAIPPQAEIYLDEHLECDSNFVGYDVYYLSNHKGKLRISSCRTCGYEFVKCLHLKNHIDTFNVKMECLLCGGGPNV